MDIFVLHLNTSIMRTLLILMMAFLLPLSALDMSADEKEQIKKIPLGFETGGRITRSLHDGVIEAYYYLGYSYIYTIVADNLGYVELVVTNNSTGESWIHNFDSSIEPQSILQISGTSGYYGVEYVTESGETYVGSFVIF